MFCELSEGIPLKKAEVDNPNEEKLEQTVKNPTEKIDIYYFDHGNSALVAFCIKFIINTKIVIFNIFLYLKFLNRI